MVEISSIIWGRDFAGTRDALQNVMQVETNLKKVTFYVQSMAYADRLRSFPHYAEWQIESDVVILKMDVFMWKLSRYDSGLELYSSNIRKITFIPI